MKVFQCTALCLVMSCPVLAQDNYEIQVYGAETMAPGKTMVELHSNFTVDGSKTFVDGMVPTNHAVHETIEITQGITDWFETGFYIFTSYNPTPGGYGWVGDHIRPPCSRTGKLASAGGAEPFGRIRLSESQILA